MSKQLELAARRQRGRALMTPFVSGAARVLAIEPEAVTLAPLEDTDTVRAVFASAKRRAQAEAAPCHTWALRTSSRDDLAEYVQHGASVFPERELYLFLDQSPWCGAVIVSSKVVIPRTLHVVTLDQQDLIGCTASGSAGVFCALMSQRSASGMEPLYDFFAWDGLQPG